ncbi:DDB1- and CUL4-associated factor 12 [Nowakowskiella sp. JEL0407]|nr:DDB1- and CUL4-associated factor 12 [Nowakowskiella sp. JEL0407]
MKLLLINILTGKKQEITRSQLHPTISDSTQASSPNQPTPPSSNCCGIHSLAINPSRTLLAVGAGKPNEFIQIYSIPSFQLVSILSDHQDMVFTVAWLDDTTLISGSRDTTVKIWGFPKTNFDLYRHHAESQTNLVPLNDDQTLVVMFKHLHSKKEHKGKVRDLRFSAKAKQFLTLSTDGYAKLWDAGVCGPTVFSEIKLQHPNETVCVGYDGNNNLYSIGSQSHISIIDPRVKRIVHVFDSLDEGWGVRSLAYNGEVLTVGGGLGRISFYDTRAQKYISWEGGQTASGTVTERRRSIHGIVHRVTSNEKETKYHQTGNGWLQKDEMYLNHFSDLNIRNAVYTLTYDDELGGLGGIASSSRLFAAGGPLQLNLCGSYASVWS